MELLIKMLNFYKKRYTGTDLESKFNDACDELISSGDISHKDYMLFCVDNDIEPKIKKKKKESSSSGSYDPCGHGSAMRSSC
jgi:hypothetical protein